MVAKETISVLTIMLDDDHEQTRNTNDETNLSLLAGCSVLREDRPKIERYVEDVVPTYVMDDFQRLYRVKRLTFEIICRNICEYPDLEPNCTGGRQPIPIDKQLLVVLYYLSGQETLNRIADRFNVTESSVVRCRDRIFSIFLNHLKTKFIVWPQGNEKDMVIQGFERKTNIPCIVGAVDGSHVRIKAPSPHPETYVIHQAVCREHLRFTHVVAGWPGSCHDARVCRNCDVWDNGQILCGTHIRRCSVPLEKLATHSL